VRGRSKHPRLSRRRVGFVGSGQFVACSALDGIHFTPDSHAVRGRAMTEVTRMALA